RRHFTLRDPQVAASLLVALFQVERNDQVFAQPQGQRRQRPASPQLYRKYRHFFFAFETPTMKPSFFRTALSPAFSARLIRRPVILALMARDFLPLAREPHVQRPRDLVEDRRQRRKGHRRQTAAASPVGGRLLLRGASAARGRAGGRQDHAGPRPGPQR